MATVIHEKKVAILHSSLARLRVSIVTFFHVLQISKPEKVYKIAVLHSSLARLRAPCNSFHVLRIFKANKVYDCLAIWIHCKNTRPYLLVAKRAHAITCDLHHCFPLVIELIFYLLIVKMDTN